MNYFKRLTIIITVCFISSTNPKIMKRAEPKTFIELVNFVKIAPNIWTNNATFSEQFINTIKKGAQEANLKLPQFEIIVDMITCRLPFSGNAEQDKLITDTYVEQKENIIQEYANIMGYVIQATKPIHEQPSQINIKEVKLFTQQLIEQNRTNIENFIKMESFNNDDTFEIFSPITSALKQQYPDTKTQKKLKPILIRTLNNVFPDMIGDLKMDSIYTILNNNLPQ